MEGKELLERLLPCPFCGKKDRLEITARGSYGSSAGKVGANIAVTCYRCWAQRNIFPGIDDGLPMMRYDEAVEAVVAAWNERKGEPKNDGE